MAKPNATSDTTVLPAVPIPARPFFVRTFGLTDRGLVRENNEDNFLIAELARTLAIHATSLPNSKARHSSHRGHVFVVADGIGGNQAGEKASELSVMTLEEFLLNTLKRFFGLESPDEKGVLKEFRSAIAQADARIFEEASQRLELFGMGTTLTMAFAVDWKLFVAHVGYSRCYLYSDGTLQQVTNDHTAGAELVRQGLFTAEQAARSPFRNIVTNVLGGSKPGVQVEVHRLDLVPGDTLLLCSDGLTGMVNDERIAQVLQEEADPPKACTKLVAEANEHGGKDNITVLITRFESS
jgi:PPM family protein phosphatase